MIVEDDFAVRSMAAHIALNPVRALLRALRTIVDRVMLKLCMGEKKAQAGLMWTIERKQKREKTP